MKIFKLLIILNKKNHQLFLTHLIFHRTYTWAVHLYVCRIASRILCVLYVNIILYMLFVCYIYMYNANLCVCMRNIKAVCVSSYGEISAWIIQVCTFVAFVWGWLEKSTSLTMHPFGNAILVYYRWISSENHEVFCFMFWWCNSRLLMILCANSSQLCYICGVFYSIETDFYGFHSII